MKSETLDCLTKSSPQSDFKKIFDEAGNLEELLMATYLRALEWDCLGQYRPHMLPAEPVGYRELYEKYLMLSDEKKPEAWRNLQAKFQGYFKACVEADRLNKSDKFFLSEMRDFFDAQNMPKQAEVCRLRLQEFDGGWS